MVNYCCVQDCGRNSRDNKYLNFYSLPKKKARQKEWLKAAGKENLLNKDLKKLQQILRICSRHFTPNSIKNRLLKSDAVPTKCLPGSLSADEKDRVPAKHEGILCNSCSREIIGFRYKCVTCENFDLCQKCEMLETHHSHYMLRIPKSLTFKRADNLIKKWKKFFKSEHATPDVGGSSPEPDKGEISSDDEPVNKYVKKYNTGLNLSDDEMRSIQNEISRTLKVVRNQEKKGIKRTCSEKNNENIVTKKTKPNNQEMTNIEIDNIKNVDVVLQKEDVQIPELVFADVNDMKLNQSHVKVEEACPGSVQPEEQDNLRAFYLKMGVDLSRIIMTVPNDEAS